MAEPFAEFAVEASEGLAKLLGWDLKPPKPNAEIPMDEHPIAAHGFAQIFTCLGVRIILEESEEGRIKVGNKESRIRELMSFAAELKSTCRLRPAVARSAAGRYQFAAQQVFGRCAAPLLKALYEQGSASSDILVDPCLPDIVNNLSCMLRDKPIRQCRIHYRCPVHIFTDGAAEPDQAATAGAILIDPEVGTRQFFSYTVPHELVRRWKSGGKDQTINQVELHPINVAVQTWEKHIAGREAFFWVDNESARHGAIKGSSPISYSNEIIEQLWRRLSCSEVFPWFARVPSSGNPADDPSRLVIADLLKEGWTQVTPVL